MLIFDEVVTGFRASSGGAQVRYGVTPDLTTMAKIVAGALPGGAVGGKADIVDMIAQRGDPQWDNTERVYHPGTFNGNPLSAVAGATCLEMIAAEPINAQADAMAARLKAGLNEVFTRMEVSGHAYGVASMIHFTLADGDFDREFGADVNRRIKAAAGSAAVTGIKRACRTTASTSWAATPSWCRPRTTRRTSTPPWRPSSPHCRRYARRGWCSGFYND